ncbi:PQQ-binding-like beta-propeller repeat protein [Paenibacillus motobuensis]|uniref:Uncharacterized protein n=1 Tax=Paenibacillus motobuensis TaxID=295324 RepID=A0ABN0YT52_9BACL
MFDKKSRFSVLFVALLLACFNLLQSAKALDLQLNPDLRIEVKPNIITNLYMPSSNGVERWTFETGGGINSSSPAVAADGTVYVGSTDSRPVDLTLGTVNEEASHSFLRMRSSLFYELTEGTSESIRERYECRRRSIEACYST